MDVEIIPNDNLKSGADLNKEPYQDLEPDLPPQFRETTQKQNDLLVWLKQNKLQAGLIGGGVVVLLGVIVFQLMGQEPPKKIVEVSTFEQCVQNKGSVIEDVKPRECYLKQVKFVEEVTAEPEPENPVPEEPQPEEPKITEQKYTNTIFPKFSVTYPGDWKKTEENTETGTTFLLQKGGITLNYNIGLIEIFGDQGGLCTNNSFLFLDLENSDWYRIRLNDGDRYYTTKLVLKSQGTPDPLQTDIGDTEKAKTGWVEVSPVPSGVYEACLIGSTNIAGVTDSSIPADLQTNTGNKYGLVTIRISGITDTNQLALKEADQIITSTTI